MIGIPIGMPIDMPIDTVIGAETGTASVARAGAVAGTDRASYGLTISPKPSTAPTVGRSDP